MYKTFFLLLFTIFISCKTAERPQEKSNGIYKDFKYINVDYGLSINFDSEWFIKTKYSDYNDYEANLFKLLNDNSEILFIGYNENRKIGCRLTMANLKLSNEEYYNKIYNLTYSEISKYNPSLLKKEIVYLKNIEAFIVKTEFNITSNNTIVYDSLFFKNEGRNYRFDFFYKKEGFTFEKYINEIFNSINFK